MSKRTLNHFVHLLSLSVLYELLFFKEERISMSITSYNTSYIHSINTGYTKRENFMNNAGIDWNVYNILFSFKLDFK